MKKNRLFCALVVGHAPEAQGAVNQTTGLTEYHFNEALAGDIAAAVRELDIVPVFRHRYRELPAQINRLNPDFIVSLHCNSFNRRASGTEVLYWHASPAGQALAEILRKKLTDALQLPNRGIKPLKRGARGSYLLRHTEAPAVIAEPFFIDNDNDLATAQGRVDMLVEAYAGAIESFARQMKLGKIALTNDSDRLETP